MAELGRIKPLTKMACPSCQVILPDFSIDDVAQERPLNCPKCGQQVRLPEEMVARAKQHQYLGRGLDITC